MASYNHGVLVDDAVNLAEKVPAGVRRSYDPLAGRRGYDGERHVEKHYHQVAKGQAEKKDVGAHFEALDVAEGVHYDEQVGWKGEREVEGDYEGDSWTIETAVQRPVKASVTGVVFHGE